MLNNAIDHSKSKKVWIEVEVSHSNITFAIKDVFDQSTAGDLEFNQNIVKINLSKHERLMSRLGKGSVTRYSGSMQTGVQAKH